MKDSERIKRMKKYLKSPCPACGDPINVCNENPDTNHYELVVNDKGKVIGESKRMFKGEKMGGVETEAEGRNTKPNLKLKKEGKKDMFDLSEFKPDDFVKDATTYECLTENAMTFLELASEKAFELLNEVYDDDDDEIKELKCLFLETKTSLSASMDTRNN